MREERLVKYDPLSLLVIVFIDLSFKSTDLSTKPIGLPVEIGF
jgi:hypothetical protein